MNTESGFCFLCEKKQKNPLDELLKSVQADTNMKSEKGLNRYICGYIQKSLRRAPKRAKEVCANFKDLYFPLSKIASEEFSKKEIDWRFANCLWLQESTGNAQAMARASDSRAAGLGQHTSINRREISNRIRKNPMKKRWNSFLKRARSYMKKNGLREPAHCTQNNNFKTTQDAKCPSKSIAATFIYQEGIRRDFMNLLNQSKNKIIWSSDKIYLYSAMAGAHNIGDTLARSTVNGPVQGWNSQISKASKVLKKDHCRQVKKVFEASQQMLGVTRCLTEGEKRAPHGISRKKLAAQMGQEGQYWLKQHQKCQ